MIGCYDFCGHYDWTFDWISRVGGQAMVREFWREAISRDSQAHARALIAQKGFAGMEEYWGHTLGEEAEQRGYQLTTGPGFFRIDMHQCPSKGFLLRNGLERYSDYCDHCMGWIGPLMAEAGYAIDHEHNHRGQCWWEVRPAGAEHGASLPGAVSGGADVRRSPSWMASGAHLDRFVGATDPDSKVRETDTARANEPGHEWHGAADGSTPAAGDEPPVGRKGAFPEE